MADQQAAMFGECLFDTGDVKITMGTGTFMNINTGSKPHTSLAGRVWKSWGFQWPGAICTVRTGPLEDALPLCRTVSCGGLEDRLRGGLPGRGQRRRHGHRHQMGAGAWWGADSSFFSFFFSLLQWNVQQQGQTQSVSPHPSAVMAELFANVQDTSAMAYSVSDSDGVCFVPSFSGLQVPCVSVCVVKLFDFCRFYHNYATVPTPISTGDNYIPRTGMIIHSWSS